MGDFGRAWIDNGCDCGGMPGQMAGPADQRLLSSDLQYAGFLAGNLAAFDLCGMAGLAARRTFGTGRGGGGGSYSRGPVPSCHTPPLTLSITGVANIALHTREKMINVMESDYVLFARARGESEISIILRHGLRNVALPAITLQFASVSEIIGGSVLVEQVFSYPGLGQAAVTAGLGSDLPLLLGITIVTAAIVFAGNLIADLLYGVIDPKIRKGAARG